MNGGLALLCLTAGALLQAAGEPASISIRTEPATRILWEGRPVGEAAADGSLSLSGMPYGRYSVVLSRAGFQTRRVTVQAEPGEKSLLFPLQPDTPGPVPVNAGESEAAAADRPAPASALPVTTPQPRQPDAAASGPPPAPRQPPAEPSAAPLQPSAAAPEQPASGAVDSEAAPPALPEQDLAEVAQAGGAEPTHRSQEPPPGADWAEIADRWWWVAAGVLLLAWLAWVLAGRMAPAPAGPTPTPKPSRDPESLDAFTRTLSPRGRSADHEPEER